VATQKQIFLKKEGDKWYERNKLKIYKKNYDNDFIIKEILRLTKKKKIKKILEIGASNGSRLVYLKKKKQDVSFYGLEPSIKAIKDCKEKKIFIKKGTADNIPFQKNFFNIIVFGFCLYLCDDALLHKIVEETFRVLRKNGYLIIYDFYSDNIKYSTYKHNAKIKVRKMDYSKLFDWHPKVQLIKKKYIVEENNKLFKDPKKNITAVITLIKKF